MTLRAGCFPVDDRSSAGGGCLVITSFRWRRRGNRKLIKLKRSEFGSDQVVGASFVSETGLRGNWILLGITQARVSDLKHGKISQFSLDLLVRLAARAGLNPKLKLAA